MKKYRENEVSENILLKEKKQRISFVILVIFGFPEIKYEDLSRLFTLDCVSSDFKQQSNLVFCCLVWVDFSCVVSSAMTIPLFYIVEFEN